MTEEIKKKLAEVEKEATEHFCTNPYWKDIYDRAPEGAKRYWRHSFTFSCGMMASGGEGISGNEFADAFEEEHDDIFREMDNESWDYVIHESSGVCKCGLHDARIHMQGKPKGTKFGWWFDETYE